MRWTVVVPVKRLPSAKSRLAPASADAAAHIALVEAIRQDTLAAVRAATGVARIVLITTSDSVETDETDDPDPAMPIEVVPVDVVLTQTVPGLNPALREADRYCRHRWPADGVAALVGDLPALRPADVSDALAQAARHPRAFVPDAAGTGTTLLAVAPPGPLNPAFGAGSARRHGRHATGLLAGAGLRLDVDVAADLEAATAHGLGPATAAVRSARIAEPATPPSTPAVHLNPA